PVPSSERSCGDLRRRMSGEGCGEPGGSPRETKKGATWGKHGFPDEREIISSVAHARLPTFLTTCSSAYLMPLPLWGSGGRHLRIWAATSPTTCLEMPRTTIWV